MDWFVVTVSSMPASIIFKMHILEVINLMKRTVQTAAIASYMYRSRLL